MASGLFWSLRPIVLSASWMRIHSVTTDQPRGPHQRVDQCRPAIAPLIAGLRLVRPLTTMRCAKSTRTFFAIEVPERWVGSSAKLQTELSPDLPGLPLDFESALSRDSRVSG